MDQASWEPASPGGRGAGSAKSPADAIDTAGLDWRSSAHALRPQAPSIILFAHGDLWELARGADRVFYPLCWQGKRVRLPVTGPVRVRAHVDLPDTSSSSHTLHPVLARWEQGKCGPHRSVGTGWDHNGGNDGAARHCSGVRG